MSRLFSLSLLVTVCCLSLLMLPARAQSQKSGPPAFNVLPFLLGAGGFVLGSAVGLTLKGKKAPRESQSGGATFFQAAPWPLALVDENEKIIRANASFSSLLGLPDASGTPLPQWMHPDDLLRVRPQLEEITTGLRASCNLPARLFDANSRLLHTRISGQKLELFGEDAVWLSLQDVTAQVEAQVELDGARAAIASLYEVIAGDARDLDGKMKALLAMGCSRFELPIGVLGRLSGEGLETLWVQSPDRRVRPALQVKRGETSLEARLLGLPVLPRRADWPEHPFVSCHEAMTYLGAPVAVRGELFGMLSFSSAEARERPPGDDAQLLQLMAAWVGGEIERDQARQAIETQQKALLEAVQKLELLATQDSLTGAKNRRAFNEKLAEEWARAKRYNTPLSLVLMDVDKFKSFNDTFGHPAGDEVLKRVARTLMGAIRTTDFFARYGGEEFVLLLPNTDAEGALILANRLREKIEQAPWKERPITASMGVSTLTDDIKAGDQLTQLADDALYVSKENGRNRVTHVRDLAS